MARFSGPIPLAGKVSLGGSTLSLTFDGSSRFPLCEVREFVSFLSHVFSFFWRLSRCDFQDKFFRCNVFETPQVGDLEADMTSLISTRSDEPLAVEQTRAHDRRQWCWLLLLLGTGVVFVIPAYVARMFENVARRTLPMLSACFAFGSVTDAVGRSI